MRMQHTIIPQTGLAPIGFSQFFPGSLDLTNFVVRSRRAVVRRLSLADSLESPNLGIQESGNLESKKAQNSQNGNLFSLKCQQGPD